MKHKLKRLLLSSLAIAMVMSSLQTTIFAASIETENNLEPIIIDEESESFIEPDKENIYEKTTGEESVTEYFEEESDILIEEKPLTSYATLKPQNLR